MPADLSGRVSEKKDLRDASEDTPMPSKPFDSTRLRRDGLSSAASASSFKFKESGKGPNWHILEMRGRIFPELSLVDWLPRCRHEAEALEGKRCPRHCRTAVTAKKTHPVQTTCHYLPCCRQNVQRSQDVEQEPSEMPSLWLNMRNIRPSDNLQGIFKISFGNFS